MRKFSVFFLLSIVLFSCQNQPVKPINRKDTVICAYVQLNNWRFNTAEVWAHTDRVWLKDSGLDGTIAVVRQIRLQLPLLKSDSIMDSVKHTLLKITPRFDLPLSDTLNHYIHILDTLHFRK
jgi:hypothetical protein